MVYHWHMMQLCSHSISNRKRVLFTSLLRESVPSTSVWINRTFDVEQRLFGIPNYNVIGHELRTTDIKPARVFVRNIGISLRALT